MWLLVRAAAAGASGGAVSVTVCRLLLLLQLLCGQDLPGPPLPCVASEAAASHGGSVRWQQRAGAAGEGKRGGSGRAAGEGARRPPYDTCQNGVECPDGSCRCQDRLARCCALCML